MIDMQVCQEDINAVVTKIFTEVETRDTTTRIQHQQCAVFFHLYTRSISTVYACIRIEGRDRPTNASQRDVHCSADLQKIATAP